MFTIEKNALNKIKKTLTLRLIDEIYFKNNEYEISETGLYNTKIIININKNDIKGIDLNKLNDEKIRFKFNIFIDKLLNDIIINILKLKNNFKAESEVTFDLFNDEIIEITFKVFYNFINII